MAIYKGNKKVVAVYKGSTPINKIYKGVTLVFQKSGGGGSTHLFEGTATGNFNLTLVTDSIPITPDADGKWFYDIDNKIRNLEKLLYNQSAVTSVDLSNFDLTNKVTSSMFEGDSNITSIKFNNTKSMKLTNVFSMFSDCSSLVSLDLSSFDVSNITKPWFIGNMFSNCTSLSTIKCKQAFKDWCITKQDSIKLPNAMREGGSGTWEIVG